MDNLLAMQVVHAKEDLLQYFCRLGLIQYFLFIDRLKHVPTTHKLNDEVNADGVLIDLIEFNDIRMVKHAQYVDLIGKALKVFLIATFLFDDFHCPRLSSDLMYYFLNFSIPTLTNGF